MSRVLAVTEMSGQPGGHELGRTVCSSPSAHTPFPPPELERSPPVEDRPPRSTLLAKAKMAPLCRGGQALEAPFPQAPTPSLPFISSTLVDSRERRSRCGVTERERSSPRTGVGKAALLSVSFETPDEMRLTPPRVPATITEQEIIERHVCEMLIAGKSLSIAMGNDGMASALEGMAKSQRDMLDKWMCGKNGGRWPAVNWDTLRSDPVPLEDRQQWRQRAQDLCVLYDTKFVDDAKAKTLWILNDSLSSLVEPCAAVKRSRVQAERDAVKTVLDRVDAHGAFLHGSVTKYSEILDKAIEVIQERSNSLNEDDAAPSRAFKADARERLRAGHGDEADDREALRA